MLSLAQNGKKEKRKICMDGGKYKAAKNVDNVDNFVEKFVMQTL